MEIRPESCRGRERELKRLVEWFTEAKTHAKVVVVRGALGVGKTCLLEAFQRLTAGQEAFVVTVSCKNENRSPFGPFSEIMARTESFDPLQTPHRGLKHYHRPSNFFETVRHRLQTVASHRHSAFILDDAQHIDEDSLRVLQYLLNSWSRQSDPLSAGPQVDCGSMLVLAVSQASGQQAPVLESLADFPLVEHLELRGLDNAGLVELLSDEHLLKRIRELTQGNPAILQQMMHNLPEDVESLSQRRRLALAHDQRRILHVLAVYDGALSASDLATLLGSEQTALNSDLDALSTGRFLLTVMMGNDLRYRLGPLAPQEAVLRELPDQTPQELHATCLRFVETKGASDDSLAWLHRIVRHATACGRGDVACVYGLRAAKTLSQNLSFERAIAVLESCRSDAVGANTAAVLQQLAQLKEKTLDYRGALEDAQALSALQQPVPEKLSNWIRIAELRQRLGDYAGAEAALRTASTLAETHVPDRIPTVKLRIAELAFEQGDLCAARAACDSCVDAILALGNHTYEACDAHNLLGRISYREGRYDDAKTHYRHVEVVSAEQNWERERARALHNLGLVELKRLNLAAASQLLDAARQRFKALRDFEGLAQCLLNLGVCREYERRYGDAIDTYQQAVGLFERLGHLANLATALSNLADVFITLGVYTEAETLLDRSQQLAEQGSYDFVRSLNHRLQGRLQLSLGRAASAIPHLRECLVFMKRQNQQHEIAETLFCLAEAEIGAGNPDQAAYWLDRLSGAPADEFDTEIDAKTTLLRAQLHDRRAEPHRALPLYRDALKKLTAIRHEEGVVVALAQLATRPDGTLASDILHQLRLHLTRLEKSIPTEYRTLYLSKPALARATALVNGEGGIASASAALRPRSTSAPWRAKYANIIGDAPELLDVLRLVERVAATDSTVLILGDSGTGKELLAEAIHRQSQRGRAPFVRINAAALSEELLLSELFGHERGAFTGASRQKQGLFEHADGGTIFLDEIGDISPKTQVTLLRVLQEQSFERVGGTETIQVNVRVILATNKDLEKAMRRGEFRLDLYYRINGLTLTLPALRDRRGDIPGLVSHFLARLVAEHNRPLTISDDAQRLLCRYSWPGNIRELENVIRSAYVLTEGPEITSEDLLRYGGIREDLSAPSAPSAPQLSTNLEIPEGFDLRRAKLDLELTYINEALRISAGNITHAATQLGMTRSRLSQKLKEHQIDASTFKDADILAERMAIA